MHQGCLNLYQNRASSPAGASWLRIEICPDAHNCLLLLLRTCRAVIPDSNLMTVKLVHGIWQAWSITQQGQQDETFITSSIHMF